MPRLGPSPGEVPDATEIRAAVARVIASPDFNKSPQLAHFIKFVVDETLAGRGERLKAYTVATDAFGRGSDFDAQHDPIVRVEAGRLRRALVHYYATDGLNDPIVITMPRGGYTPEFHTNTAPLRAKLRMWRLQRRAIDLLRDNYRLVLMMVIVAVIVSLVLDLLGIAITKSIWPGADRAKNDGSPAVSSPDATGGLKR